MRKFETWMMRHPAGVIAGVAGILAALFLFSPVQTTTEVLAPMSEDALVKFGADISVGQEFAAPAGLTEIAIPVFVADDETGPLLLHVRETYFGEDVRTATAWRPGGGLNRFTFRPLIRAQKLIWILEAPNGPRWSAGVYREVDDMAFSGGEAFVAGKNRQGNFAFTMVERDPLGLQMWQRFQAMRSAHEGGLQLHDWERETLLPGVIAFAVGFGILLAKKRSFLPRNMWIVSGGIAAVSFGLHVWTAGTVPVINDEGGYLQDVGQARADFVPFRDYLTKGPLYLIVLGTWQAIVPHTMEWLRLISGLAWAGATFLVGNLAKSFGFSRMGQIAAMILFALAPAAVVLSTPILLEPVSVFISLLAVTALMRGIRKQSDAWIAGAAMLMVAAYLARASSLVAAAAGGLALLFFSRRIWRDVIIYVATGAALGGLLFAAATGALGLEKAATLFNLEAYIVSSQRIDLGHTATESFEIRFLIEQARILWWGGALILSGVLLVPAAWGLRGGTARAAAGTLVTILLLGEVWRQLVDMEWLLPRQSELARALMIISVFIPAVLAVVWRWLLAPFHKGKTDSRANYFLLVMLAWIALASWMYGRWGFFRNSYLMEFMAPLALLSAWAIGSAWEFLRQHVGLVARAIVGGAAAGLFVMSWYSGMLLLSWHPPTGTMELRDVKKIVAIMEDRVPGGEEVFTAQGVVTALARRPIVQGYTHSGWYLYEQTGEVPTSLRRLFFMEPAELTDYLRENIQFVLTERRTSEVYFDAYPERQKILANDFELVAEVANEVTGEPFRLYQRN